MATSRKSSHLWWAAGEAIAWHAASISVLILALSLIYPASQLLAEEGKTRNLYEQSRPAVLMVAREFKCMITVPRVNADEYLFDRVKSLLKKSGQKKSAQSIADAITEEFKRKPTAYLERSSSLRDFDGKFTSMGTGFLATSRGHVVTNAHVVRLQWADVLRLVEKKYMERDCLRLIRQMQSKFRELKGMTRSQTEEIVIAMHPGIKKFYRRYTRLSWTRKCKVLTRFVDANSEVQLREYPAEVVQVGSSIPGKDVAVLKIEAPRLSHCLPLGDESLLNVGDQIYVIGYPAAATFNPWVSKISVVEASLSRGIISAKKTALGGWVLLQHDAATGKGSSGGPALDDSGKVIGIHTFGSFEQGEKAQGSNFIVPVSVVREFLARAGVRIEDTGAQKAQGGVAKPSGSQKAKPDVGDESGLEKK